VGSFARVRFSYLSVGTRCSYPKLYPAPWCLGASASAVYVCMGKSSMLACCKWGQVVCYAGSSRRSKPSSRGELLCPAMRTVCTTACVHSPRQVRQGLGLGRGQGQGRGVGGAGPGPLLPGNGAARQLGGTLCNYCARSLCTSSRHLGLRHRCWRCFTTVSQ
jgi:hypothetical protein